MTTRDIMIFLFRWHRHMAAIFVFIVGTIIFLQYALPQSYSANSVLLVEHNRSPTMRSDYSQGLQITETLNTEVAILNSRTVISNTVDRLEPHERPSRPSAIGNFIRAIRSRLISLGLSEFTSPREGWIRQLTSSIGVEAVVQSNIITVSYANENAELAADIVNTIVSSYIEHRLEIFSPQSTANIYRAQMDQIMAQLTERRQLLDELNQSEDINAAAEQRRSLLQQRSLLMERIVGAEVELADLRLKFGPGHDRIRSINELISTYQNEIESIETELQLLESMQSQTVQMRLNIQAEESLYQAYKTRYDEERLKEFANSDLVNVRVVEHATVAERPDHSRLFYVVLGSMGALILSFGFGLLFEYLDRRITNINTAENILGIGSLGSIREL